MKKVTNVFGSKSLVFGLLAGVSICGALVGGSHKVAAFSGSGTGESSHPYQINTCAQLQSINQDADSFYALAQDIDCSGSATLNGGDGWAPIVGFDGSLDGQNHKITDLTINQPDAPSPIGLFESVNGGGIVKNLTLSATVTGQEEAGILIGDFTGGSHIINVTIHGSITCTDICGSLAGYSSDTVSITGSHSDATINGNFKVGGLVGEADSGSGDTETISNSYYSGQLFATAGLVGGIAGPTAGLNLTNVFSSGIISSQGDTVGGLLGSMGDNSSISLSYSTANISGNDNVGGLVGSGASLDNIELVNVYYIGTITLPNDSGVAGGIMGSSDSGHIQFAYAAGTINGGQYVGGIVGAAAGTDSVTDTFAAMNFTGNVRSDKGPTVSDLESSIYGSDNYFDSTISGFSSDVVGEGSIPISDSSAFLGNSTNPPMSNWTFDSGHWRANYNNYPSFGPLIDPQMECQEVSPTDSSIHIACDITPLGWGTPTWELRYRAVGDSDWTNVTLDDIHQDVADITGLVGGTDYEVNFRFTNDFGTSDWGLIDFTTTGSKPVVSVDPANSSPTASSPAKATATKTSVTTDQDLQLTTDSIAQGPATAASDLSQPKDATTAASSPKPATKSNHHLWLISALILALISGYLTFRPYFTKP